MDKLQELQEHLQTNPEEVVKKKRGRKKKSEASSGSSIVEPPKKATRKGRKSKSVVESYAVENTTSIHSDDENVIVRLNIKRLDGIDTECEQAPFAYDATEIPYDAPDNDDIAAKTQTDESSPRKSHESSLRVVDLLKDFEMKSKASEWPQSTTIACYWCCHTFSNPPFGIPVKYVDGKFHVFGCFCSLECASAFNFNSLEGDEIWERYNLINLLSKKIHHDPVVKPAPNRFALTMFGGHVDIDTFRNYNGTKRLLNVNFPPMITVTQQIEEINECDVNSDYRYLPIDNERINRYKQKLTLSRTKPITKHEHTLDHMMNLKIG